MPDTSRFDTDTPPGLGPSTASLGLTALAAILCSLASTAAAAPDGPPADAPPAGFVVVPAGRFELGGYAEGDQRRHTVTFTRPLWVQAHEVTRAEWSARFARDPSIGRPCPQCPVDTVTWYEAAAYANARSAAEKLSACYVLDECQREPGHGMRCDRSARVGDCAGYRLPTESEWAYFARAGTTTAYWSGDAETDLDRVGWYLANSQGRAHPVGEKPANPWGLHDVHGNVWEWTDPWRGDFPTEPETDPRDPADGFERVVRGGSFRVDAEGARVAERVGWRAVNRDRVIGFRLVRAPRKSAP